MKRFLNAGLIVGFTFAVILIFVSCGGGGGGGSEDPSSNWDEMAWDQDNWA